MQLPTIHTTGTGRESLVQSLTNASNALMVAYAALLETAPHGRDYFFPDELAQAGGEHRARLSRLSDIQGEIYALALAIDDL